MKTHRRINLGPLALFWIEVLTISLVDGWAAVRLNPHATIFAPDDPRIAAAFLNVFVVFGLIAAWFASQASSRFNKAVSALHNRDRRLFMDLIRARTSITIKMATTWCAVVMLVLMHIQHFDEPIAAFIVHSSLTSIVVMILLVLRDLDDPVTGIVIVGPIPEEWREDVTNICNHHAELTSVTESIVVAETLVTTITGDDVGPNTYHAEEVEGEPIGML